MEPERPGVEIDREALGEAVAETEAVLAAIDAAPRLPAEDPLDFLRVLRESLPGDDG